MTLRTTDHKEGMTPSRLFLLFAIAITLLIGQHIRHFSWAANHKMQMQICLSAGETAATCEISK